MAEEIKRAKDEVERKKRKAEKRKTQAVIEAGPETMVAASPAPAAVAQVAATPVAFLFPGQGSQAVGMLKVRVAECLLQSPSYPADACLSLML